MQATSGLTLRREVFDALVDRGCFPPHKLVQSWFIINKHPYSPKNYTALRRRELAPESFTPHFIRCVLTHRHKEFEAARDVLINTVLPRLKLSESEVSSISNISTLLCTRDLVMHADAGEREIDWVAKGVLGLVKAMMSPRRLRTVVRSCADEETVRAAVRWAFIDCGRDLVKSSQIDDVSAIQTCADRLRISFSDCVERTTQLWKRNPWTILLGACDGRPVATCMALPLTKQAGVAVAAGTMEPFEMGSSHVQTPSTYVWTEMACVDPSLEGMRRRRATKMLTLALAAQGAAITRMDLIPRDTEIRMVSMALVRTGIRRLKKYGYKKLGISTPISKIQLVGRRLVDGRGDDAINRLWFAALRQIGREVSDLPEPATVR